MICQNVFIPRLCLFAKHYHEVWMTRGKSCNKLYNRVNCLRKGKWGDLSQNLNLLSMKMKICNCSFSGFVWKFSECICWITIAMATIHPSIPLFSATGLEPTTT